MLGLAPSARLGGPWPGLLPVLLALLGMAQTEPKLLPLQAEQAPMPGGKGPPPPRGEERGEGARSATEQCQEGLSSGQTCGV